MKAQFIGSSKLHARILPFINEDNINSQETIYLVERGYDLPKEGIVIEFDSMDYSIVIGLLSSFLESTDNSEQLVGFKNNSYRIMNYKEILYIEANKDGIIAHGSKDSITMKQTLSYYENRLSAHSFIRINKSQIVNIRHITEIIPWFNSRYVIKLISNKELEVSKFYAKIMRKTLNY